MSDPAADRVAMPPPQSRDSQSEPRSPKTPKTPTRVSSSPASNISFLPSQVTSNTSGAFSATARPELERIFGDLCWACNSYSTQLCHIFGKKDTQDDLWAHLGLINYSPCSASNAILLCPLCYMHFDRDNDPAFVFVPIDLDYFIQFEQADRLRRQEGEWPPGRQMPTGVQYTTHLEKSGKGCEGYTPVFLKHYLHNTAPSPQFTLPKYWQGAPAAALRRCIMALGSGRILSLGPKVAELETLRNLYFSPIEGAEPIALHDFNLAPQANPPQYEDPLPPNPPQLEQSSDCEVKSSCSSESNSAGSDTQAPKDEDPDFNPENTRKRKDTSPSTQGARKHSKRDTTSYHYCHGNWAPGPMATSQDAILRYSPIFARG